MTTQALGILLIVFPVLFIAVFAALGKTFEYPAILREPAGEVLERFAAGGSRLVLLWWSFAMTVIAFVPIVIGLAAVLPAGVLGQVGVAFGLFAALVQLLGLIRWVFLVPLLARERHKNPDVVDLVFDVANRYFGIAVGEHLGYVLTGLWTILVSIAALPVAPAWIVIAGLVIGASLLFGALEFLGPFEERGWPLAGTVVSIAYTAWAAWLIAGGVVLLVSGA
jgi:hypothetical protein